MKNVQTPFLVLCGAVCVLLGSCDTQVKKTEAAEERTVEKVAPPKDLISLKEAKSRFDSYSKNRVPIIQAYEAERDPEQNFVVGRFVSFDYKMIKQYMDYVEQESEKAGVEVESLRFYFSNLPEGENYPNGRKVVHPRQNGIFILPTTHNAERNQEFGFYIGADGKAKLIRDWSAALKAGASLTPSFSSKSAQASLNPFNWKPSASLQGEGSLILNFGQAAPPPPSDF